MTDTIDAIDQSQHHWSRTRPDRHELARCGLCGAAAAEACTGTSTEHTGRRYTIWITSRGYRFGADGDFVFERTRRCSATIETRWQWDFARPGRHGDAAERTAIVYRGACLGCGWAGPDRPGDENAAVADAHDHTLPRWRDLPIVERLSHDANPAERQRWADDVAVIYATYGFDDDYAPGNGGAIRTWRQQNGTRSHHVSLGANGYYDLSAGTRHPVPVEVPTEQLELF